MKKHILAAALGSAIILAIPAFATTTNYVFNTTGCGTAGNPACGDNISPYAVTSNGVTATALGVYYSVGSASAFTNAALTAGDLGAYGGAGLGACETVNPPGTVDCTSPNHQIDNGKNGTATDDFEFVLIKFSAAVNLSSIQLGNFGGGSSDPFNITYYTSTSTAASLALAGTTLGSGNSFSSAQTQSSQSGACTQNNTCVDNLSGAATSGVTYLLIGASIHDNGTDYFKIQDLNASTTNNSQSATPEPATFGMIGLALAGLGVYGRKRRSRNS
jgi:PEP-CTERM motif